jgi:hypothetical protein
MYLLLLTVRAVAFHMQVLLPTTAKKECRTITHGVNIECQNFGSPLDQTQEISNIARCLETAFYILVFYVFLLYVYLNMNTFSETLHQLTVLKN